MTLVRVTLGEVIKPRREKGLPTDDPGLPFLGLEHVEAHTMRILGTVSAGTMRSSANHFYSGDVLYGRLRPYLNKVCLPAFDGYCSAEFIVFPKSELIESAFLKHLLNSRGFVSFASHLNAGDRPRVDFDQLSSFSLLLPSLPHQHRIVETLEKLFSELDKGIESLKTAREQLKIYRQAVLKNAFEGKLTALWRKGKIRLAWEKTKLGCLLSFLTSGSRGWAKFYTSQGDLFIRAQNLKHDRLDLSEIAFVTPPETSEGVRTRVQVGDVLITITGANVTKTGYVHADLGKAYVSQHVALCRPDKKLDTEFLYLYLIAERTGRRQLNKLAYGAGKPGLNLDNIRSVEIFLPPLDEQKEIVKLTNEMLSIADNLASTIEAEMKRVEVLRQSILKKAFSGQLVPQNPTDEPASVLLDRIRAEHASQSGPSRRNTKRHPRGTQAGPA